MNKLKIKKEEILDLFKNSSSNSVLGTVVGFIDQASAAYAGLESEVQLTTEAAKSATGTRYHRFTGPVRVGEAAGANFTSMGYIDKKSTRKFGLAKVEINQKWNRDLKKFESCDPSAQLAYVAL